MKYYSILLLALFSFSSCNKILDQQPQSQIDPADAFSTRAGVEAGLIGIYDGLQAQDYYGLHYWVFADLYADNLSHTGTFPTFAQVANKQLLADNVNITNMWNVMYNMINRANNVIKQAQQLNDPLFDKSGALAQARCLRALCYFDLIRYFGGSATGYNKANGAGVPLVLEPTINVTDATPKARATEAEVYTKIIEDLDFAMANLPASAANGRLTKNAATALKARLQLYREQWEEAETLSTAVISQFAALPNGGLVNGIDYTNLWLQKNAKPESIWELQFFTDDANSGAFYYYTGAFGGRNEIASTASLGAAHETGDVRLPVNRTVAAPGIPANKTRKFSRVAGDDNVILIRLAELYLIRAEARARKTVPDIAGAQADLNLIRNRAGLTNTTAVTVTDLVTAVRNERRVELAHEGHRWFDLRRYNRYADVGITEPHRSLFPVPQREVLSSGNVIKQNTGY
ncbi:SusD-like starch-binding protein associating with outer membrane [Lacibacter cauensis]|uniref:SusD-like starch-binding protein associating with outer membrane n=1 Tax=Lacibacter cauensis TaxID=510947 RepID=A0A562SX16_9BACT|nr:RagB/SusD family nutrient uptake outer membrane protein [Lacibacter cauensis]TWI85791.1 SusD-like starch-binding protein associating with outer membrane [Lacibacter cauensis]